jgi:hypothetical protein|tara:strand:+ start:217 stop:879 length:663 start_codon:yes stop_codon:yes gene_type:complete
MLNISDEEKQALLNQHSRPYDGYQTLRFPEPDNRIHTYDPAGDKVGVTVNNKGEVKRYTNVGINESMNSDVAEPHYGSFDYVENKMCEACGGSIQEDVCEVCGESYMNEDITEPYSEIDFSNYDFDSKGPEQFEDEDMQAGGEELFPSYDSDGNFLGMVKLNGDMEDGKEMYPEEKPAYEFDSPGPYGATNTFEGVENPEKVKESIKESLNWFKRFSNFN